MAENYSARYVRMALKDIPDFEKACEAMGLNVKTASDADRIVRDLALIGQFGTLRLYKLYPHIVDEATFRMIADVGLKFYWMTLDYWESRRAQAKAGS